MKEEKKQEQFPCQEPHLSATTRLQTAQPSLRPGPEHFFTQREGSF